MSPSYFIAFLLFVIPCLCRGDGFDDFLRSEIPPSDGFDSPHQRGQLAPGQDCWAIAKGRVLDIQDHGPCGRSLVVGHQYYENHHKKFIASVYSSLRALDVFKGEIVRRHQKLGRFAIGLKQCPSRTPRIALRGLLKQVGQQKNARLDFSLGQAFGPKRAADFFRLHSDTFVPQNETTLLLVDVENNLMRRYAKGQFVEEYQVSFGQKSGRKRRQGDLKTPRGMYFVVDKSQGPFTGAYGAYFGGHWIKLNYPNAFDAEFGRQKGLISTTQASKIRSTWKRREATLQKTKLGGGIGFHGWDHEWSDQGLSGLSWGCIVLHQRDVASFYQNVSRGSMVVLF